MKICLQNVSVYVDIIPGLYLKVTRNNRIDKFGFEEN